MRICHFLTDPDPGKKTDPDPNSKHRFNSRCVFEALRMPLKTNIAWFGLLALDRIRDRTSEFPSFFLELINKIPHFRVSKNMGFTT